MPQSQSIYNAFEPASFDAWKKQVIKEVKGEEAFNALYTTTPEGVHINPYYTLEDIAGKEFTALNTQKSGWAVQERITANNADAIAQAQTALQKGAEQVVLLINDESVINTLPTLPQQVSLWQQKGIATQPYVYNDVLMALAEDGNFDAISTTINPANTHYIVNAAPYHNAGANTCTQLAITLAHANEYSHLGVKQLTINVAIGSDYFFEIAKLRALRKLWALLAKQYGANENTTLFAETALNNKTIYDYNNNILRASTEAMAAIIGGCNAMYVHPYDVLFKQPHPFSARIARNVQLVLKNEAYLDKVNDAAHGSYFVENLSEEIAAKSWQLFQQIEAQGGWIANLQNGFLQNTVSQQAQATQQQVDEGKHVVLGVNKYPNANEKMKDEIEAVHLADNKLFPLHRYAAKAEQERLAQE